MTTTKICIVGLNDYPMLSGDISFGYVGGEAVQHVLLAKAWRDLGLDVSILVYDHGQPRVTTFDGIRAIATYAPEAGIRGVRFVHPRLTHVVRAMREVDADIYYQSPAGLWAGVTAWFARRFNKRCIIRIASDSDCMRGRQPIRYRRDRWLFDYGILNATMVAAQTEQQRRLLEQNYAVRSEVVNIAVEVPKSTASRSKDIDVLWVGNVRRVKRPDLVIELARRLPQYRFVIIGASVPGAQDYFDDIAAQARTLPNVVMTGGLPYQATGEWFDRARIHVNTSDYEGFPNTFLQAWVRGLPVVSFFDPDGVIHQRGLGYSCTDLEDMYATLMHLLESPAQREAIACRAYAYATANFAARQIATRYLDLLECNAADPMPIPTGDPVDG